jgi:hypothetical protein
MSRWPSVPARSATGPAPSERRAGGEGPDLRRCHRMSPPASSVTHGRVPDVILALDVCPQAAAQGGVQRLRRVQLDHRALDEGDAGR